MQAVGSQLVGVSREPFVEIGTRGEAALHANVLDDGVEARDRGVLAVRRVGDRREDRNTTGILEVPYDRLHARAELRGVGRVTGGVVAAVADGPVVRGVLRDPIVDVRGAVGALRASRAAVQHHGEVARMAIMNALREARLVRGFAVECERGDAVAHEKPSVRGARGCVVHVDLADLHAVRALHGNAGDDELHPTRTVEIEEVRLTVRLHLGDVDDGLPRAVRAVRGVGRDGDVIRAGAAVIGLFVVEASRGDPRQEKALRTGTDLDRDPRGRGCGRLSGIP